MGVFETLEEYVLARREVIDRGEPIVLEVRNTDSFERLVVKALVAPPGQPLPGAEELVLRNLAENVGARGWKIRVLEELDAESVQSVPMSSFRKDAGPGA